MRYLILVLAIFQFILSPFAQGDECSGAVLLTSSVACTPTNGNTSTGFTDSGVGCSTGDEDDDGWYKFVAVSTSQVITADGAAGFDAVLACYVDCTPSANPTGGSCVDNSDDGGIETLNLSGLTIGSTYYIKIHDYATGGGNFTICVTGTPPPSNDECSGATSITVGTPIIGTTAGADQDYTWLTEPCSNNGEVWYKFTTPATVGCYSFWYDQITNGCNAISIWETACPTGAYTDSQVNFSTNNFNDQGSNESELAGMVANTTYYISVSNTIDANFNLNIRASTPLAANDVCSAANGIGTSVAAADNAVAGCEYSYVPGQDGAIQSTNPGACDKAQDFPCSSSTGFGPLAICALTLENISWYKFVAAANGNITISFSGIECNNGGGGFQSGLFSGSNCASLTATGACLAGSSGSLNYSIPAAVAGATYYIAMDGNAGSNCHYNVSGLNITPLPIELGTFKASLGENNSVKLNWNTFSERNNDYFTIEKSKNGITFEFVGRIKGAGNSSNENFYSLVDEDTKEGTTYYRLTQTDFDGKKTESSFTDVTIINNDKFNVQFYPNPSNLSSKVFVKINNKSTEEVAINIFEINGKLVDTQIVKMINNETKLEMNHQFTSGVYIVQAINSIGEVSNFKWIIE